MRLRRAPDEESFQFSRLIVILILVLHKKLEKLFIAPKVRQELHETTFVAFATKGQRE